jgi:hypothetical protein
MNSDNSFEFELQYRGELITCRVDAGESDYGVHFDYQLVAMLELDEDGVTWLDTTDTLEPEVVQLIGKKIEERFE